MACLFPVKAYRSAEINPSTGKRPLVFKVTQAHREDDFLEVPCNNCIGCKLEHARQWSMRMMHEARYYEHNCFLTLTYDDQHVPRSYGLELRDLQLFFKRLRKALGHQQIRYFACGEYGDLGGRPHYHAIVFNFDPPDKVFHGKSESGENVYSTEVVTGHWQGGFATTQEVTHRSCGYVARYVTKKIKGADEYQAQHYYRRSPIDGEMHSVRPEFAVMSRRPGIGKRFADEFKSDFYPSGYLIVDGIKQSPPRFYLDQLSQEERDRLKKGAAGHRKRHKEHSTMQRRRAKAEVLVKRIKNLKRN